MRLIFLGITGLTLVSGIASAVACENAEVEICFRPGVRDCQAEIVRAISAAERSLLVQAYNFTAVPVIQAIGNAKKRGVNVRVLLDKDNEQKRYTAATYLMNADALVRIDYRVAIAHNKVMVIDGELTVGGSYNYSASAESRNAENVTFIRSACVAAEFTGNFEKRWVASRSYHAPPEAPR